MRLSKFRPDTFTLALVGTVLLASLLPVAGRAAQWFGGATQGAVALLFFLHGVALSRQAVLAGLSHWRLHGLVFVATFLLFPLLGLAAQLLPDALLPRPLAIGVLFLCCLPSTIQSSIAFTSLAGGNVPAAICSASLSNLLGVFLTPLMISLLLRAQGHISLDSVSAIILQILLPFALGQLLHPRLGRLAARYKRLLGVVDRGSILMVVYGAFSEAVVQGLWRQLPLTALAVMALVDLLLLAVVLLLTARVGSWLGLARADRITLIFCGSKKSLASGVPMANILFPAALVGPIVLPVMLFHQIQLMACAVLARRFAAQTQASDDEQGGRLLKTQTDRLNETGGVGTINDAMIEGG
jgi:sodium/bile acid cotransporter 7